MKKRELERDNKGEYKGVKERESEWVRNRERERYRKGEIVVQQVNLGRIYFYFFVFHKNHGMFSVPNLRHFIFANAFSSENCIFLMS